MITTTVIQHSNDTYTLKLISDKDGTTQYQKDGLHSFDACRNEMLRWVYGNVGLPLYRDRGGLREPFQLRRLK